MFGLLLGGTGVGWVIARWRPVPLAALWRGQLVMLGGFLAFASGWLFDWNVHVLAAVAVLLIGDLLAVALATRKLDPVLVSGSQPNDGFWSVPIAAALFGTSATVFVVLYSMLAAPRAIAVTRSLRRAATVRPSSRSALADYFPQAALLVGFVFGALLPHPPALLHQAVPVVGEFSGLVGFTLLGLSLSSRWPDADAWRRAAALLPVRFGVTSALCVAAAVAGLGLPASVWVLALAPAPFGMVALSRVYHLRDDVATAAVLLTLVVATALLALVPVLGRLGH